MSWHLVAGIGTNIDTGGERWATSMQRRGYNNENSQWVIIIIIIVYGNKYHRLAGFVTTYLDHHTTDVVYTLCNGLRRTAHCHRSLRRVWQHFASYLYWSTCDLWYDIDEESFDWSGRQNGKLHAVSCGKARTHIHAHRGGGELWEHASYFSFSIRKTPENIFIEKFYSDL